MVGNAEVTLEQGDVEGDAAPSNDSVGRAFSGRWSRLGVFVGLVVAGAVVLAAHGFLPGMSQVPLTAFFGAGAIQCLHDQGIASLWTWCQSLGMPIGAPRLTGLPQVYLGWLVSYVPGVDAWAAHQITKAFFDVLGLLGAVALLRRWRIAWWIAIPVAAAYLLAPNVLVLNGFPYTFIGYILLPAFWGVVLHTLDLAARGRWFRAGAVAVVASLFMAFTDGYAFMTGGVVAGVLVLHRALVCTRARDWTSGLGVVALWLMSLALAAGLYVLWVPDGAYQTDVPLEYFGLLAVDVVTLVTPTAFFALPGLLGFTPPQLDIWGISDTMPTHYLGFAVLALGLAYVVLGRRGPGNRSGGAVPSVSHPGDVRGEVLALAVAGVVTLVLSLGPTLRIGQVEPGLDASMAWMPTVWLYEHVPGFTDMRATSRWLIATRFAVLALAAAGLQVLWQRLRTRLAAMRPSAHGGHGALAAITVVLVMCVGLVEQAPNAQRIVLERQRSIDLVHSVRDGVVAEAASMLSPEEVVLVLPSVNDFLANYLVPMAGVRSYNVGGDKNWYLARDHWPEPVAAAVRGYGPESADLLCAVLDGYADAIVLPYIDPYAGVLIRTPDPERLAGLRWMADVLSTDARFVPERGETLTVLRKAPGPC